MTDLDDSIRSGLEHLAVAKTPKGAAGDDLLAAISNRRRSRRRARRLMAATASVVLLGAVAAVAITALDRKADDSQVITDADPLPDTTAPDTSVPETTQPPPSGPDEDEPSGEIPGSEAPLSPRTFAATAWTGSELVVWGGTSHDVGHQSTDLRDGATYDPATGSWRMMALAPEMSNSPPLAVMATDELVLFSGRSVAAWNPVTDTWRQLPDAPADVGQAVWTGEEVIVASTSTHTSVREVVAALDPVAGTWRDLPSQGDLEETVIVWTGEEVIALGREAGFSLGNVEGRALDPTTDTWRDLPTGPLLARGFGATWVEDRVMVVNYRSEAATYDPSTDTWTALAPMPTSFGEVRTVPIAVGEHVVIDAGGIAFVGDRFGTWTPVYERLGAWNTSVPGGSDLLLVVQFAEDSDGSLDAHPPRVVRMQLDSLLDPALLWLGQVHLVLDDSMGFERAELIGDPAQWQHNGVVTTISVDGEECTVTRRFGQTIVGTPAGDPVEIVPEHGGERWTAYLQGGGDSLRLPTGSTVIECEEPGDLLTVARALEWQGGASP